MAYLGKPDDTNVEYRLIDFLLHNYANKNVLFLTENKNQYNRLALFIPIFEAFHHKLEIIASNEIDMVINRIKDEPILTSIDFDSNNPQLVENDMIAYLNKEDEDTSSKSIESIDPIGEPLVEKIIDQDDDVAEGKGDQPEDIEDQPEEEIELEIFNF